jgi:hypothetical protein
MPTAEGKGYHKHACRSTAQYFVVRDSSSTPLSPISVSEISSCPHSDSQLSTVQHYSMHDSSSTLLSPISVSEISSCPHSDSQLSTAQHFVAHDLSSAPLSPISVLEIAWCPQSDSPLSPLASLSLSPVVTYPPLPAQSCSVSLKLSPMIALLPVVHTQMTPSSTSSQHLPTSVSSKKRSSTTYWHMNYSRPSEYGLS